MPRRKISTPVSDQVADLPVLSAQELALVEAKGQGCDNSEAYRRAYGAEGYSAPALHVRACRKVAEPHIQAHLRALNEVGFAKALLSREAWLTLGMAQMAKAEAAGNHGAAGLYWKEIGKAHGYLIEQVDVVHHSDPLRVLGEISQVSPDLARALAKEHGIPWPEQERLH